MSTLVQVERDRTRELIDDVIAQFSPEDLTDLAKGIDMYEAEEPGGGLEPGVHVMSMHKAKGLTADMVFLPCLEAHVLPGPYRAADELGEARRILYVAMTRAKDYLLVSTALKRTGQQRDHENGRPRAPRISPFIEDYFRRPGTWPRAF
jgi:superfamily I DNA/RNA helicase